MSTQTQIISANTRRFLAYYAMGYGTEVSKQKGPYVYTPAFTKTNSSGKTVSGGVSVGITQIDFSQRPTERNELLAGYNVWAATNGKPLLVSSDLSPLVDVLGQAKSASLKLFLSTDSGKNLVDKWDKSQIDYLISNPNSGSSGIEDAQFFSALSPKEQAAVATAVYAANNKRGNQLGQKLNDFMDGETVNGFQIEAGDTSEVILTKFKQVIQTNLGGD